jgi:cob(I)alamin adenosyltransferase
MPADRQETPIVLSRIYTRTGDQGTTALGDGSRAAKNDLRLAAYADVDEANCAIGAAVTMGGLPAELSELLIRIQNELFDLGADLSNPITPEPAYPPLRVTQGYIDGLLHTARTVVRRAERSAWAAISEHGPTMNPLTAQYLNRLSDLLFILARYVNEPGGDLLWKPGGDR